MKKISYADCILNAAIQLVSSEGQVTTAELQARAAQAEAWLLLGEALRVNGWVDLDKLRVEIDGRFV